MDKEFVCEYSLMEEILNSVTHGIGVLLSVAGLVILVVFAAMYGNVWHLVSYSIFGVSMILLYLASTLYHSIPSKKIKFFLKKIDHSAIFLLIAGTYTPFALVHLKGIKGWVIFGVVWAIAIIGIALKFICLSKIRKVSSLMYIAMGWVCIFVIKDIMSSLGHSAFVYLVLGGLVYTLGVIFYAWKNLKYNHAIWHVFVLGGSVLHFFAVFKGFFHSFV